MIHLIEEISAMQIDIPDATVRDLQVMLARQGSSPDLTSFVNRTLQRAVFFETVREVQKQNTNFDPVELQNLIDQSVDAVRVDSRS
jgi:hypothetical protein